MTERLIIKHGEILNTKYISFDLYGLNCMFSNEIFKAIKVNQNIYIIIM